MIEVQIKLIFFIQLMLLDTFAYDLHILYLKHSMCEIIPFIESVKSYPYTYTESWKDIWKMGKKMLMVFT